MQVNSHTIEKLCSVLLLKIEKLEDNPLKQARWILIDSINEWDGIDFATDDHNYLQISFTGRVVMYDTNLVVIFQSQI